MLALAEADIKPVDLLIVDEAQDIMSLPLLDILGGFITGGLKDGHWRIFCDVNNQASVFGVIEQQALERLMEYGRLSILAVNRRNTKEIAEETAMLSKPRIAATASVSGIPVEYHWYHDPASQKRALSRTLKRLHESHIAPTRITVLSPRANDQSCAGLAADPALIPLNWKNISQLATGRAPSVTYCTISAFKGLENDFIVLTDVEDLDSEWWRSVIYVGMSRARVGLHLLLNERVRGSYEQQLRDRIEECDRRVRAES